MFAPEEVRNDDDASVNREAVRDRHELADHDDCYQLVGFERAIPDDVLDRAAGV
mgnify:CR=1 FL=1